MTYRPASFSPWGRARGAAEPIMSERLIGRIKIFDEMKGWGFIRQESGPDLFIHVNNLIGNGWKMLLPGDRVEYEIGRTARGPQAVKVVRLTGQDHKDKGG
jgi:CspA family cold shock protein